MLEELGYEISENIGVRGAAEYTRKNDPILHRVSLMATELCYL
jgi:hypothetical protein